MRRIRREDQEEKNKKVHKNTNAPLFLKVCDVIFVYCLTPNRAFLWGFRKKPAKWPIKESVSRDISGFF